MWGIFASSAFLLLFSACVTNPAYRSRGPLSDTRTVGATITTLPSGYQTVDVDGSPYYYHDGSYYNRTGSSYTTIDRPLRYPTTQSRYRYNVRQDALPDRYQTVRYRDRDYYFNDGVFYEPRGSTYYTIRDPFGY